MCSAIDRKTGRKRNTLTPDSEEGSDERRNNDDSMRQGDHCAPTSRSLRYEKDWVASEDNGMIKQTEAALLTKQVSKQPPITISSSEIVNSADGVKLITHLLLNSKSEIKYENTIGPGYMMAETKDGHNKILETLRENNIQCFLCSDRSTQEKAKNFFLKNFYSLGLEEDQIKIDIGQKYEIEGRKVVIF